MTAPFVVTFISLRAKKKIGMILNSKNAGMPNEYIRSNCAIVLISDALHLP